MFMHTCCFTLETQGKKVKISCIITLSKKIKNFLCFPANMLQKSFSCSLTEGLDKTSFL